MDTPLILLADDDPVIHGLMGRMLRSEGYRLEVAATGPQTLEKFALLQPDVVLLDVLMPDLDGFAVCTRLQEISHTPVIMITALDDQESIDHAFAVGASDFVTKPIYWPVMRHRIRRLLSTSQVTRDLQQERNLLRTLIDTLPDYVYVKDTSGRFLLSNIAHARAGGAATPDEMVGKTAFDFWPQALAEQYFLDDQSVIDSGEALINAERITVDATGNRRVVLTNKVPLRDAEGTVAGLIGVSRDITERKQAEEALRRSETTEREQRLLAETLTDSVDLKALTTRILESPALPHDTANIMLVEGDTVHAPYWHGYPAEQVPFISTSTFHIDELYSLRQMRRTGKPCLIAKTAATPHWAVLPEAPPVASYIGAPLRIQGQIIGFLNLNSRTPNFYTSAYLERLQAFADLAAIAIQNAQLYERLRHHAEEMEERVEERTAELRRLKEQVEAILDYSSDSIAVTQVDGSFQKANPAFARMFGAQPGSLLDIAQPEYGTALRQALHAVVENEQSVRVEVLARTGPGTSFNADIALAPIAGYAQWNIVCSIRDITERKQAEAQRLELALARERTEALKEFLSAVSHDLKTPLSVINTSVYLLERLTNPQEQTNTLQVIKQQVTRLSKLIQDILEMSRLESAPDMEFAEVQVNSLLENTLTALRSIAEKKGLSIVPHLAAKLPPVRADADSLNRVWVNLIENALNYTLPGGQVTIQTSTQGEAVVVQVSDTGIGINEEDLAHIFERFYRADKARSTHSGGTGLGLSIVKKIVEIHGGQIEVESKVGVGSTFRVKLPIAP